MIIYLDEIYSELESWRVKSGIASDSKKDYLINVMGEFGEISTSLRLYKKSERVNDNHELKCAKHFIINNICNIAVLTILAADKIPSRKRETTIDTSEVDSEKFNLNHLIIDCGTFFKYDFTNHYYFNSILKDCAKLCEYYGYNLEQELIKTVKEISSLTGDYNERLERGIKSE